MKFLRAILLVILLGTLVISVPNSFAVADSIDLQRVKWDHSLITVFIEAKGKADPDGDYEVDVQTAFNDWISGLNAEVGDVVFEVDFLPSPETRRRPADIHVQLKKNTGSVLGTASTESSGGIIQTVKINLATQNALGIPLDRTDFRTIARHEIGHSWALRHTTDDNGAPIDLMHPTFDFVENTRDVLPSSCGGSGIALDPQGPDIDAVLLIYGDDGFGGVNLADIPASFSCSGSPPPPPSGGALDAEITHGSTHEDEDQGKDGDYGHRDLVHILVRVTDGGVLVEGAAVHLVIETPNLASDLVGDSTTNSDGIAHFHYKVNAGRDGRDTYHIETDVSKGEASGSCLHDDVCHADFDVA